MKTQKIMIRDFGFGSVRQNHKTSEVCLTDVLTAGNAKRLQLRLAPKRMSDFLESPDTVEYIETFDRLGTKNGVYFFPIEKPKLILRSDVAHYDITSKYTKRKSRVMRRNTSKSFPHILRVRKGQFNGTWAHPFLAIKLSAWLDKEFEVLMHKTLWDGLLEVRDQSGESYKEMTAAISKAFPKQSKSIFSSIGFKIQERVLGQFNSGSWESSSKEILDQRDRLHLEIASGAKWAADFDIPLEEFLIKFFD